MTGSTLFLFTNNYPYDTGEEFMEDELFYLSNKYDNIYIFPGNSGKMTKNIPVNAKVVLTTYPLKTKKTRILLLNSLLTLKLIYSEILYSKNKLSAFKYLSKNITLIINQLYRVEFVYTEILKHKNITFYSYWTNEWSLLLSILKKKNKISNFICRAHGYDLFENRHPNNYLPFRNLIFSQAKAIVSVSERGEKYLTQKYNNHSNKFSTCYLGVKNLGNNPINKNPTFHIVSCSRLDENKRILLLAQALKQIEFPLKWTHFGDGYLMNDLKNITKQLPKNISVDIKGHVKPNIITDFYNEIPLDLFINVSISEGLPVTLMEAISFGIPIMATDAGGSSEIANSITGILLPKNITIELLSRKLVEYYNSGFSKNINKRNKIKEFWSYNFNAPINFDKFYNNYLK